MFIQLVVSPLRKYGLVFVLCLFPLGQIAGIYQQFPAVFAARPVNLYDSPVQPLTGAADNRIILVISFVLLIFGIVNVEIGIGEGNTGVFFLSFCPVYTLVDLEEQRLHGRIGVDPEPQATRFGHGSKNGKKVFQTYLTLNRRGKAPGCGEFYRQSACYAAVLLLYQRPHGFLNRTVKIIDVADSGILHNAGQKTPGYDKISAFNVDPFHLNGFFWPVRS